ncbi:hypothetical protein FHX74_003629 [Friedmanniella endophytica]|uniref:DUF3558 domain-containing protein n=1 Tax=Microlunatus kandeliicorticis TaxID=1759536 RepID=A0A7W3P7G0_9ACTN|nr:hypothetical protein [Microlunatus kandeliicorticis]MBA8795988.1 hypothetical protein [Microlunatus kandeliicorticis]
MSRAVPVRRTPRAAVRAAVAVAVVAVAATGCSGSGTTAGGTPAATSSATSAGTSTSPSAALPTAPASSGAAAPSAQPSGSASVPPGLCAVVSVAEMSRLTGFRLGAANPSGDTAGNLSCTYTPSEAGKKTDVALIVGEGTLTNTLDAAANGAKSTFDLSTVGHTTVTGADGARVATGRTSGVTTVFVVAAKGDRYYTALTGGSRSAADYTAALQKVLARLVRG